MVNVSTTLVQAYLHVNGYFTTADYPLVEQLPLQSPRMLTDVDMLAVRFSDNDVAGSSNRRGRVSGPIADAVDAALDVPRARTDMIVAEIKQGRAQVNPAARNRHALAGTLARFGCCEEREATSVVQALLQHGQAEGARGHVIRMVLFAAHGERAPRGWHWVRLDRVFEFLDGYLRREQHTLGHVDLHDPALAWLALQQKCGLSLSPEK